MAMAMAAGRALGLSKGLLLRSSEMGFFSSASFCYSSSSSSQFLQTLIHPLYRSPLHFHHKGRLLSVSSLSSPQEEEEVEEHALLLERLRSRHLPKPAQVKETKLTKKVNTKMKKKEEASETSASSPSMISSSFSDLSLSEELLSAVNELGLTQPTEVQCRAIPAVLDGKSVVIASHTGSGKTLAYMLPLVQSLRRDEIELEKASRPRRPRAVVLCPTRELAEQVFRVAKSICHHAKFRVTLIGGGVRMRPQEDALNAPIDMLVGTPGRLLKHIEDANMAYGDLKYVVLDEADTMFDRGFGPEIKKFLGPLRNRSLKAENSGFQTILVTATITQGVQRLLDDEFPGIKHIRTSTLHKKISNARHGFIKLSGTENKLESLLQVLEPSLSKGERVMVFCNTLNSCRAVDHFLRENNISTVNYHGAVPADERVEVLKKFKNEGEKCPALVCTDLAARGLDLVVDHVIMFDFPLNSIDYLHRTGRTARMGAKGRITSLVAKRSLALAELIEEAIHKGLPLDGVTTERIESPEAKRQSSVRSKSREGGKTGRYATTQQRKFPIARRGISNPKSLSSSAPSTSQKASKSTTRSGSTSKVVISKSRTAPIGKATKGTTRPPTKLGQPRTMKKTGHKVGKVAARR